jgi:hypothetical protein
MAATTKPPPDWVCHSEAAIKRFEAWTNAQLDEIPTWFEEEFGQTAANMTCDDYLLLQDPKFAAEVEHEASARLKRSRVIRAAREGDHDTLARLADTEELRRLALPLAFRRHRQGREKGEWRPRDLPQTTKWRCEEALADVKRIRQIWKQHYGRRNRTIEPTAIGIAARRWSIKDNTLINFKKNRHRVLQH